MLTFAEPVSINFKKSAGAAQLTFEAGREYVIPQQQFTRIVQEQSVAQRIFKVSRIESRIPNFNVGARKTGSQRLLLYNGSGGYGDQIMTWPFARVLTSFGFEVHVLSDPGNQTCWWNFPWIKSIQSIPMQFEQFKMFDYWVLFEAVVNTDEHMDQGHPLDVMLNKVGIDPNSIESKLKSVRPNFTWLEMQAGNAFQNVRFGMYQLASANQVRCLPPNDSAFLLSKIADAYPHILWLALHDEFIPETYRAALVCPKCSGKKTVETVQNLPPGVQADVVSGTVVGFTGSSAPCPPGMTVEEIGFRDLGEAFKAAAQAKPVNETCPKCRGSGTLRQNIQLYTAQNLRDLWSLASKAAAVVAPDSMMVHVAGSMDVPCVGLWGLCNPANRVKYYKNHVPIWKRDACPFSPCFAYSGTFPKYCPPRPNRSICECLGAIAPQDVIDALKQIIPLPSPPAA